MKRSMILQKRSQNLARFFFGAVAISRRSPDRPEAGRAYQADNGAGAIPNASVSLWLVKGAGVSAGTCRLGQAALATAFAGGFADSIACI